MLNFHSSMNFDGFHPSLLTIWMTERRSYLVHVARGPPSLHYYCAVVLHSCILLPPVGHSSNNEYHCCQLIRQSSCVSKFYRTFKGFHLTLPRTAEQYNKLSSARLFVDYTYSTRCKAQRFKITYACLFS